MFLSPNPGLNPEDPDPALLAFIKCHITSPAKWEVLRVLASHDGAWVRGDQLARGTHRQIQEVARALNELVADAVVEMLPSGTPELASFRMPSDDPTAVVLRRLIEATTHSQELRAIIAAHLQRLRQQAGVMSSTAAA